MLGLAGTTPTCSRIVTSAPLSLPATLAYLPLPQQAPASGAAALGGLLLIGSTAGASQALGVPQLPAAGDGGGGGGTSATAAAAPWPLLQSALLPSLAPVQCVTVAAAGGGGPGGLPEAQVLVGCGVAPRGRLARLRSGVGLRPFILDGPELPVSDISGRGVSARRR